MELLITTQYSENYGNPTDPYWKFKGGEDYIIEIPGFRFDDEFADKNLREVVDQLRSKIEFSNDMASERIVGYKVVEDGYFTEFERSQLTYDGVILYPAKRFVFEEETVLVNSDDQVI